jgi:hypothetical protein
MLQFNKGKFNIHDHTCHLIINLKYLQKIRRIESIIFARNAIRFLQNYDTVVDGQHFSDNAV